MNCPGCSREVIEGKSTCPFCGLIFAKYRGPSVRTAAERAVPMPAPVPEAEPEIATERIRIPAFVFGIAAALVAVLIIALGIRYFISGVGNAVQQKGMAKSAPSAPIGPSVRRASLELRSDFDLTVDPGGDPLGLVWGDGEFVVGNRTSPWGFLKLKPAGEVDFTLPQSIPVIGPANNQQVGLSAVAWNGKQYVGYASGAYFDKSYKNVFTIHDPKTLEVTDYFPAPELIGGLTWDGSGYWAATRRSTLDTQEPAFLYRLDRHFNVLGRYDPPAVGCQGLAWDGSLLWWVDVFTNDVYLVRVDGSKPETVHTYHTRLDYLSGVTFDGANVWIVEYRDKRLRRLNPTLKARWSSGDYRIANYEQASSLLNSISRSVTAGDGKSKDELVRMIKEDPGHSLEAVNQLEKLGARDEAIQALQETTRSPDDRIHSDAKEALRQIGVAPSYDRYSSTFNRASDDADVIEASAEIAGDKLRAAWRIYFGSQIFATPSKSNARYRVILRGGSLSSPVVRDYEAKPGDNVKAEELAAGLGSGRYSIEFTISAQFADTAGASKSLNKTSPPLEVGK